MFVDLLLLFMLLLVPLSYIEEIDRKIMFIYGLLVFLMVLLAGFRPFGVDEDSMNYLALYYNPDSEMVEPSFFYICHFASQVFNSPRVLFVVYAMLSVCLKGVALVRLTRLWFLSLLVWTSHYYIMQDLTQIRVAVSTGFFLLAVYFLAEGKRWWYTLLIACATLFHFSSVILFFLLFLSNKKLTSRARLILVLMPVSAYVAYIMKIDPVIMLPIPYIQNKIEVYETMRDIGFAGDEINVFNIAILLKLVIFYFLIWKYEIIEAYYKYLPIMLKIYALSLTAFAGLAFLPVLSFRVSELLGVVDILLIPMILYAVKPRYAGVTLVVLYAVGIFMLNVFYNEYLKISF